MNKAASCQIQNLSTAIFSDFSSSILKFPTSIIHVLEVSKDGKLLFELPRPYTDISGMEASFPVALHFYNKKYNYYVNVDGLAHIISINNEAPLIVLVKMSHIKSFVRKRAKRVSSYVHHNFPSEAVAGSHRPG